MFSQEFVCPQGGGLSDVASCLAAWFHVPSGCVSVPPPRGVLCSEAVGGGGFSVLQGSSLSGVSPYRDLQNWRGGRYTSYWNAVLFKCINYIFVKFGNQ